MDILYAPWRMTYIRSQRQTEGCVFCRDARGCEDLIVAEGKRAYVLMNAFPYISGHVLIIPRRHVGRPEHLTRAERLEIFDMLDLCIAAIQGAMEPHGFNVGMNLGKTAGAGVDGHLHMHVVPRWNGDTNFMGVVGDTRVIPENVADTCQRLRAHIGKAREVS